MILHKNGVEVDRLSSVASHLDPTSLIAAFNNAFLMNGNIDEVRIWSEVVSQTVIREWMCKKVQASHPRYAGMIAYYKFDEKSSTSLTDSSNSNNGTVNGTSSWIFSGAAIGDDSAFDYTGLLDPLVNDADGASFQADGFTGSPDGAHVYLVNESPNVAAAPTYFSSLESTRYFGVFIAGGSSPTYTSTYSYTNNTNLNGVGGESTARFVVRDNGQSSGWARASNESDIDISLNVLSRCNLSGSLEFSVGFESSSPVNDPGSGYQLDLDGSGDYVSIGEIVPTTSYTKEAWVKIQSGSVNNNIISGDAFTGHVLWAPASGGYRLRAGHNASPTFNTVEDTNPLLFDTWYHVALTYDAATQEMRLYKNGVEVDMASSVPVSNDPTGFIGAFNSAFELTGSINEVRLWSVALSESDIRSWMLKKITTTHPNYCNLLTYYRVDETSGAVLRDWNTNLDGNVMGDPVFSLSDVPLGDEVDFTFSVDNTTTLSLTSASEEVMTVDVTSGSGGALYLYRMNENPNVTTPPAGMDQLSIDTYWGVESLDGSSVIYSATLDYACRDGISLESNLRLATRSDNADLIWTDTGIFPDVVNDNLFLTGQTGTEFILASVSGNPLPVEFGDFRIDNLDGKAVIRWSTFMESQNDFFQVERSGDALNWSIIDHIKGSGDSNETNVYSLVDRRPLPGQSYYRLAQVDFDGTISYHENLLL
ncbi:MAG: LamG domain-containing protein, partial [Bacteroidota bacterium]